MGKTHDDEVYEKGVRDGQRGGFLDDLVMGNISAGSKDEKIYKEGYTYGAQHRYGSEGRYHTWSGSGSNDPKSEEIRKSEKTNTRSYKDSGASFDYEDRHYRAYYPDISISKPSVIVFGVLLGIIFGVYGLFKLDKYIENKKPEVRVARKYNLNEKSLVRKSLDFSWTWSSESSEYYRKDIALYRLKNNKKEITPELEENLMRLRKLMESKKKEIRFNDYSQSENNIWVAGESKSDGAYFGYMWYSPDCGNTWFWQWRIGPWLQRYNFGGTPDVVPFGVYFFDSKEGWSFTQNSIFHTVDGGRIWERSYVHNLGKLERLYIIDRQNLVAMRKIPTVIETNKRIIHSYWFVEHQMIYTIDGGRTWESHPEWKPEILGLQAKLIEDSSIKLESPYK